MGPNTEIAHVQNPVEVDAEFRLERLNVLVESFDGAMNVAGRAKEQSRCLAMSDHKRLFQQGDYEGDRRCGSTAPAAPSTPPVEFPEPS